MGWAGPTKTGLDPAPKTCWAGLGPTVFCLDLGRTDPDPYYWARPCLAQTQKKKWNGGNYFSPVPPACRTILHAGGQTTPTSRKKNARVGGDRVPGAAETAACWRGCGGGGGSDLAHGGCQMDRRRPPRFACFCFDFLSPLSVSNYSKLLNPGLSVAVFEVLWFLSLLRSLSLTVSVFVFSFLRVALLFSSFFSSPFFFGFFSIYRGKVLGPMVVGSGCRGWFNHPRQPGAVFFSLSAGGLPTTSIGGPTVWGLGLFGGEVRERERREVFQSFSFLLLQVRGGRKTMNSVVQNDTVLVFFFYIYIWNDVVLDKTRCFI